MKIVSIFLASFLSTSLGLSSSKPNYLANHHTITSLYTSSDSNVECAADESYVVEWNIKDIDSAATSSNAQIFASSNCWGCRPFLLRNAFNPTSLMDDDDDDDDGAPPWPSWEDVVDIAADEESESRIISHIPGDNASFDLQWGPLTEKDLDNWLLKPSSTAAENSKSKQRRDTLVVNDIDRFYPPLANWMYNTFHFLPNWRMDDGQISLSELGGGIGPHVDNYDVFLIQMSGRRTWQVGRRKISAVEEQDRMIAGLDVRVLDDWSLDSAQDGQTEVEEWIVEPGDVLYLPPRVAHCGTSLTNDSMTLSVGCRAPSVSDLVSKLAESLSSSIDDSAVRRYTDHDLLQGGGDDSESSPGELTSDAKESAKRLVLNSLASLLNDDERWDEFFGRYVTEQKRLRNNYPIPLLEDLAYEDDGADSFTVDANAIVEDTLSGKCVLYQAEGIAFAYSSTPSKVQRGRVSHRFFVNGEMWQSTSNDEEQSCLIQIYQAVANHRRLDQSILLGTNDNKLSSQAISFLEELVDIGVLYNM